MLNNAYRKIHSKRKKQHILTTAIIMQAKPWTAALLCQNHHFLFLKFSTVDILQQQEQKNECLAD